MSTDRTALGDRMKTYEAVTRSVLPRRTYTIIRCDGKAFHAYLRGAEKPFDAQFMADMDKVTAVLCKQVDGTVFAFTHSDEISLLLADFGSVHTEPWFGGNVQKMASVSASIATMELNAMRAGFPLFDARVFTIPSQVEVANYFIWRQRDCVRNSVAMAAQAHFPHKRLHGLDGGQMQELLWSEKGVNWNDYPDGAKRGRVCVRVTAEEPITYTDKRTGQENTVDAVRSRWVTEGAPHFTADPGSWLARMIPALPTLTQALSPVSS